MFVHYWWERKITAAVELCGRSSESSRATYDAAVLSPHPPRELRTKSAQNRVHKRSEQHCRYPGSENNPSARQSVGRIYSKAHHSGTKERGAHAPGSMGNLENLKRRLRGGEGRGRGFFPGWRRSGVSGGDGRTTSRVHGRPLNHNFKKVHYILR